MRSHVRVSLLITTMSFSSESSKVTPPAVVMTIAGSDSSGGAGIQVRIKQIKAFQVSSFSEFTYYCAVYAHYRQT